MISSNPFYLSGRVKFEAGDYQGALHDYNQALEMEENPAVYSERAVVFFHLGKLEESLTDMDYAAELEPENPYRYASRAYIKDAMGDVEGAIRDYERTIALDPEDSIAHNNLGLLQEKLGYRETARQHFDRADKLAEVDKLLERIRADQGQVTVESTHIRTLVETDMNEEDGSGHAKTTNLRSLWMLLKRTFTTREGFRDYLQFLRHVFK